MPDEVKLERSRGTWRISESDDSRRLYLYAGRKSGPKKLGLPGDSKSQENLDRWCWHGMKVKLMEHRG